jgi:hypothetical protein
MPVVTPDGVQAEGNVKVWFVPGGVANPASPKLTELNATTTVDLSGYIKGGTFTPTAEQATGDDRRLASRETYQVLGRVTRGFDDVQYVYDPQNTDPTTNKAYNTLEEGVTGDIVVRWGIDAATDAATDHLVDVTPVEMGAQRKIGPAENDEFARLVIGQKWGVTGPTNVDVALVL